MRICSQYQPNLLLYFQRLAAESTPTPLCFQTHLPYAFYICYQLHQGMMTSLCKLIFASHVSPTTHSSQPCLSYAWGPTTSSSPTITLLPYEVDLEITESCFQALWHIRKQYGAVKIWVDSVCINQDADDEKASQIPLMGDIYSSARIGYIWLGEGFEGSDLAIQHLEMRARYYRRLPLACLAATSEEEEERELDKFRRKLWKDIFCE